MRSHLLARAHQYCTDTPVVSTSQAIDASSTAGFCRQKSLCSPWLQRSVSPASFQGWGNQSSKTTPSRVHLLIVNQFVLMSNFVHPLHPTYALRWAVRYKRCGQSYQRLNDAPHCPSLLTYVCHRATKRWKSNGHSGPWAPRNGHWKKLGRKISSHPAFGEAWAEATCITQETAVLASLFVSFHTKEIFKRHKRSPSWMNH